MSSALRVFIVASLLLSAIPAGAVNLHDDAQLWTPVFLNIPNQGRLVGQLELHPRVRGDFERLSIAIVRPWIGWKVGPHTVVHGGYGWIRSDAARVTIEHRAWQQIQHTGKPLPGMTLTGRTRLEQRWLERVPQTAWRNRSQVRLEQAFGGGPFYFAGSDEAFVHLNTVRRGPTASFDQNRVYVGLGKNGERLKIEGGYQHVWVHRIAAADSHIHCLVLTAWWWPLGRGG